MRKILGCWSGLLAGAVAVTGCAVPDTRVILLPQAGEPAAAIVVSTSAGRQVVEQPYASVLVAKSGELTPAQLKPQDVQKEFGGLLQAIAPKGGRHVLYFQPGGADLIPESEALLPGILDEARARAGGEMVVTGHTDTVGDAVSNDQLSLRRAEAIRGVLVERGFRADLIEAVGRGERELLVPTPDNTAEPRNRRVVIEIR